MQPRSHDVRRFRTAAWALGAAAGMGGLAVWNELQARKAEQRSPPRGAFVSVDGLRLHYVEQGEGPPVLLLHGNIVTSDDYVASGVFQRLVDRGHRVIAVDQPGFGYSDRPRSGSTVWDQARVLRHLIGMLNAENAVVVGHSWGAHCALALALNYPRAVAGLVLVSGYYFPTFRPDAPLASMSAVPGLGPVLRHTVSPIIGKALMPAAIKLMFSPSAVPERFKAEDPAGLALRPAQIKAEAQDSATIIPTAGQMSRRYAELDMPVAILAGTKDRVAFVDRHAVPLHRAIPHSSLRLLPNVGHMVHYQAPEAIVDAVENVGGVLRRAAAE